MYCTHCCCCARSSPFSSTDGWMPFSHLSSLSLSSRPHPRLKELIIHDAAARPSIQAEREKMEQLQLSIDRLDTALLHLDNNLMFFNTF